MCLGLVGRPTINLAAASNSYSTSLAIREQLTRANPANVGWQRDLSMSHITSARAAREGKKSAVCGVRGRVQEKADRKLWVIHVVRRISAAKEERTLGTQAVPRQDGVRITE
jgi:hypothetical protein